MPSRKLSAAVDTADLFTPTDWKEFHPSAQQAPIGEWFREGDGSAVVRARAGCGKTTTILWAIDQAPEQSILLAAFGKDIQRELKMRVSNPHATVQTLHSIGFKAILRSDLSQSWKRVGERRFDRQDHLAGLVTTGLPYGAKRLVGQLVTKAREITPLATDIQELVNLALDFDIIPPQGDVLTLPEVARAALNALELACTREPHETGIDFADMIFLPLRMQLLQPEFDLVVVDEAQDMSASQLLVMQGVAQPYARYCVVGDDRQAIFGFRGADSRSLDRLKGELRAQEFPMSVTYRCPKLVVALAQQVVPDFTVDDAAPDGIVDSVDSINGIVLTAEPGDFVLSRRNAPNARVAMALLRAKKRTKILGRDVGLGLVALVRQLAKGPAANSIPAFLQKLTVWQERQCDRMIASKRPDLCERILDQAATLRALGTDADSVPGLTARIEYLFADNVDDAIVCSTVHKAKGKEADRVFVLRNTFGGAVPCECGHRHPGRPCGRCGCTQHVTDGAKALEEDNLWYTAITRSKRHLTFCEERF